MKDHRGCRRAFVWNSKAWYAKGDTTSDYVSFGMFHRDGSASGEMSIRWERLCDRKIPKLQVYSDAWSALSLFTDLIQELAKFDNENITEEQLIDILKKCNFEDITEYKENQK